MIEDGYDSYYPGYSYIPTLGEYDSTIPGHEYHYTYTSYTDYLELPSYAEVTLTRAGAERVKAVVNISKFANRNPLNSKLSFIGQSTGTATVYVKPASGDAINVSTSFDYSNYNVSNVKAVVSKGNTMLLDVSATCTPKADDHEEFVNANNAHAVINILNKLTIHLSTADGKQIADAYSDADSYHNRYDKEAVEKSKNTINNSLTAYIVNGNGQSTVRQAEIVMNVRSREEGYYDYSNSYSGSHYVAPENKTRTRYSLLPVLRFMDATSYAFEDYFTESFFKTVIDKTKQLGEDFKK